MFLIGGKMKYLKIIAFTLTSLFFSKLAFAETAPGFGSWDDVLSAADGGQVNVYMWGGSDACLLYTSPSPRDRTRSRMPSSA